MAEPPVANETREEVRARRISTEDMVRAQLDRINQLRSDVANPDRIPAWSEAIEALADLSLPWAKDDKTFLAEWEARPVAVVQLGDGTTVAVPTAKDCREAQRILMRLLDRAGVLVKRRTASGPAPRTFSKPEAVTDEEPVVAF